MDLEVATVVVMEVDMEVVMEADMSHLVMVDPLAEDILVDMEEEVMLSQPLVDMDLMEEQQVIHP